MPEIDPEAIEWDEHNIEHATRHGVSVAEIEQAIAAGALYRRNKRLRSADLLAFGVTRGGRRVVIAVRWESATRTVRPITAWEE